MRARGIVVVFYAFLAVTLFGFGAAGPTAGAPWAVVTGTLGLLGTAGATIARIAAENGAAGRGSARGRIGGGR
jgi:hypothetical protein